MTGGLDRRRLLLGGAAIGAVGGLAGITDLVAAATGAGNDSSDRLRIGYLPIVDAAPLLVAHGSGLYERHGAEVDSPVRFRDWAALAEAFVTRQVDVVHLLMPMAVQLRYALGADVRIIAWNHTNGSALTVHRDTRELTDLAGQRVAIPYWWSIHNIVLQDMFRAAGLRPVVRTAPSRASRTVELVVMSPSDMLPALDSRTIGGYIVADPFNAAAETQRAGRIQRFVGDVWRDHACCAVLTHQDVLDRRPQQAQALTDAITAAQRAIDQDRYGAAEVLSGQGYLPQPLPAVARSLTYPTEHYATDGALHHPEWSGQRIGFQPFPFPSFTERLVHAMRRTVVDGDRGFLRAATPGTVHGRLVDDRFVRDSIGALGGPGVFGLPRDLSRVEEVNPA